jgi:Sigma-70 region 2
MDFRKRSPKEQRELFEFVLAMAYRITKSRTQADEIAQETFLRLLTTRLWDERKEPSIERHLMGIVKSLISHERASKRSDYESEAAAHDAVVSGDAAMSAEARSLDRAQREREEAAAARRVGAVRAKLVGRELELRICDHVADGVPMKPAILVELTGRSLDEVNKALDRVRRYTKSILAAERGEDEEVA